MKPRVLIRAHRLVFAALGAVRRWPRACARGVRPAAPWRPLALRWRRPRAAASRATIVRDRAIASGTGVVNQAPRATTASWLVRLVRDPFTFATTSHQTRSRLHERERLVLSREMHALTTATVHRERPAVRAGRRRAEMRAQRPDGSAPGPQVGAGAVFRRGGCTTAPHASPSRVTRDFAPVLRPRSTQAAPARGARSAPNAHRHAADAASALALPVAAIAALQRAAPLVWRQGAPRGETTPGNPRAPAPALREFAAARAASRRDDAAPAAARGQAVPPPPTPAVPRLDAAFVDRLAEDVIRRVEKRARIERERRGAL